MHTRGIADTLASLLTELTEGPPQTGGYILNPGDPGLLRSLEKVSAEAASRPTRTGSSISAHVDHVRFGFSLMNRWAQGENPFATADWTASWKRTRVSEVEWQTLQRQLREEVTRWREALRTPREVDEAGLSGLIGSIAHLAYHIGAIRQIDQAARGPVEIETRDKNEN